MAKRSILDEMDQTILRILSDYEGLTPLELWYEIGEDDGVKGKATEEEILSRLESLEAKGFVEAVTKGNPSDLLGYRAKSSAQESA